MWPTRKAMATTEAAIDRGLSRDLYVALGDPQATGGWAVRTYVKPFANWIWIGALVMALGGVISLTDRRYRVGAPARRAAPPPGRLVDLGGYRVHLLAEGLHASGVGEARENRGHDRHGADRSDLQRRGAQRGQRRRMLGRELQTGVAARRVDRPAAGADQERHRRQPRIGRKAERRLHREQQHAQRDHAAAGVQRRAVAGAPQRQRGQDRQRDRGRALRDQQRA